MQRETEHAVYQSHLVAPGCTCHGQWLFILMKGRVLRYLKARFASMGTRRGVESRIPLKEALLSRLGLWVEQFASGKLLSSKACVTPVPVKFAGRCGRERTRV